MTSFIKLPLKTTFHDPRERKKRSRESSNPLQKNFEENKQKKDDFLSVPDVRSEVGLSCGESSLPKEVDMLKGEGRGGEARSKARGKVWIALFIQWRSWGHCCLCRC